MGVDFPQGSFEFEDPMILEKTVMHKKRLTEYL